MDRSGHVVMHQADEFEVAGLWKRDGIRLPIHKVVVPRGHARGAIEAGAIGRGPWTAPSSNPGARGTDLTGFEEGHRMNLVSRKGPRDAVARVNPELIGQKRQRLDALVSALSAHDRLPDASVNHLGSDHSCQ